MMTDHQKIFDWIEVQPRSMKNLVVQWARINTHTFNTKGLEELTRELMNAFSIFGEEIRRINLTPFKMINYQGRHVEYPLADAFVIQKRPRAQKQVLMVCHMDTVYPPDHHFQDVHFSDEDKILGPGTADAKGGIAVLLKTLEALEQSPEREKIGWTVIINPDEEIGSPSSGYLFEEYADQCHLGLVFEPCLPNGRLVGARKGSGLFTLVARGKSAHAGRNIDEGKNAIDALAQCISKISRLHRKRKGLTVNAGIVHGGIAANVVAEAAMARYNIRFIHEGDFEFIEQNIKTILKSVSKDTGVTVEYESRLSAKPKPLEGKTLRVFEHVQACGKDLGLDIQWENSGGVCDGNRLQSAGLPTIDTLGVHGGEIHSDKEYVLIDSLAERTKLVTLCLLKWAKGEWDL